MQRVLITGSSGYLGALLVAYLRRRDEAVRILGVDIKDPPEEIAGEPNEFATLDVCSDELTGLLRSYRPDTVIHSAFLMQPIGGRRRMQQANLDGMRNLLRAVAESGPRRLLVLSSATAYGAWPDNPVPMDETHPLRPRREFQYCSDKCDLEEMVARFAREHGEIATSWVRPTIVAGPGMDNYLKRFLFRLPLLVKIGGHDTAMQFVHEEDLAASIREILIRDGRGPFNIAPPDWTHISEIARETDRRTLRAPFWLARLVVSLVRPFRRPEDKVPPGFLYFLRYPWVVSPVRLEQELGYRFRYSSLDTLREIADSEG